MSRVSLARDCFRSLPLLKLMNMCLGSKKTSELQRWKVNWWDLAERSDVPG